MSIDARRLMEHGEFLRALARRLLHDEALADDVVQDAWVTALEKPPRKRASLRPWLTRVTLNLARKQVRAGSRRAAREKAVARPEGVPSAAELIHRREVIEAVVDAVFRLDEPYRSTVVMRFYEGASTVEIAERFEVPVETVRTRLGRALAKLRQMLDARHGERSAWAPALLAATGLQRTMEGAAAASSLVLLAEGALLMFVKAKLAWIAAAVVALGLAFWWLQPEPEPREDGGPVRVARSERSERPDTPTTPLAARLVTPEDEVAASVAVLGESIRGRVVSREGAPLVDASVALFPFVLREGINLTGRAAGVRSTRSDTGGLFSFEPIAGEPLFVLFAEHEGYAPRAVHPVARGEDRTIVLDPAPSLNGRVLDLEGNVISGARLAWSGLVGGARIQRAATSEVDGTYRMTGLPLEHRAVYLGRLSVEAPGFAPLNLETVVAEKGPDGDLVRDVYLPRGATMNVHVVDGETGEPLAGARVVLWQVKGPTLMGPSGEPLREDRSRILFESATDEEGRFSAERIPAWTVPPVGNHTLSPGVRLLGFIAAVAPGYAPASQRVSVPEDGEELEVWIRCLREARVVGRVVDERGSPVASVRVGAGPRKDDLRAFLPKDWSHLRPIAVSDDAGRYEIGHLPASRDESTDVRVRLADRAPEERIARSAKPLSLAVAPGQVNRAPDLVVVSSLRPAVQVTVRSAEGRPVWGASLEDVRWEDPVVRTDPAGQAVYVPREEKEGPVPLRLRVQAPGFATRISGEVLPAVEPMPEIVVELENGHRVSGRVVDGAGEGLTEATVLAHDARLDPHELRAKFETPPAGEELPIPLTTTRTDELGGFELGGLPANGVHLRVGHWRASGLRVWEWGVAPGSEVVIRLPLETATRVTPVPVEARIHDAVSARPLTHVSVLALKGEDEKVHRGRDTAVSPGLFEIEAPPTGRWELHVRAKGYEDFTKTIEVVESAEPMQVEVLLQKSVSLRGIARTHEGLPLANARLYFTQIDGRDREETTTNAEGMFQLISLTSNVRYRAQGVTTGEEGAQWWSQPLGEWTLASGRPLAGPAEILLEPASGLVVRIDCAHLPAGSARPATPEQQATAAASRLDIRTLQGDPVWSQTGITQSGIERVLPRNIYIVRLEVPGASPEEKTVDLGEGGTTVVFEVY